VQQRAGLLQQVERLSALRRELEAIDSELATHGGAFLEARRQLFEKRSSFIAQVIGGNPYVRMELVSFGSTEAIEDDYREMLGLNGGYESSILNREAKSGLLYELYSWENRGIASGELQRLVEALKTDSFEAASGKSPRAAVPFLKRMQKIQAEQPSLLDALSCYWPEDLLRVKYARDPSKPKFEELEKGSAGQKAAAILAFLLSYGEEPMIIDQPEEDLDNALIYDLVVKQIKENKRRRQLVVVTHNPNVVVNGDAELIYALKFEGGQVGVGTTGGLEEDTVRTAICDILEGGREAFVMRYRRIIAEV
jgi:hypothetical protein